MSVFDQIIASLEEASRAEAIAASEHWWPSAQSLVKALGAVGAVMLMPIKAKDLRKGDQMVLEDRSHDRQLVLVVVEVEHTGYNRKPEEGGAFVPYVWVHLCEPPDDGAKAWARVLSMKPDDTVYVNALERGS
jgi:hypothetical protein